MGPFLVFPGLFFQYTNRTETGPSFPPWRLVQAELSQLHRRAYQFSHFANQNVVKNNEAAEKFHRRLREITKTAMADEAAAKEYHRPEIRRFFYFLEDQEKKSFPHRLDLGPSFQFLEPEAELKLQNDHFQACMKNKTMLHGCFCRLRGRLNTAQYTFDPIDNAVVRHQFLRQLKNYFEEGIEWELGSQFSEDRLDMSKLLIYGLTSGLLGRPVRWNRIEEIRDRGELTLTATSPKKRTPQAIELSLQRGEAIELSIDELPADWLHWLRNLPTPFRLSIGTLNDFIRRNIRSLVLMRSPPNPEESGTTDPASEKAILYLEKGEKFSLFHLLALFHETFHLYSGRDLPRMPPSRAHNLLEERNAFLFMSEAGLTLMKFIGQKINLPREERQSLEKIAYWVLFWRTTGLSLNGPLGFSDLDDTLHFSLGTQVKTSELPENPYAFFNGFVKRIALEESRFKILPSPNNRNNGPPSRDRVDP